MIIEETILSLLAPHVGEEQSISADDLLEFVRYRGFTLGMPELRGIIHDMRKRGVLIGSGQSGYFLPETKDEAKSVIERQFRVPARDLLQTARMQRAAANAKFAVPSGEQLSLFHVKP